MNLHIPLSPEAEAKLRERAIAAGKDIDTFVLEVVERTLAAESSTHTSKLDAEETFRRSLAASGLLSDAILPQGDSHGIANWKPLVLLGRPLSETIIEDRG